MNKLEVRKASSLPVFLLLILIHWIHFLGHPELGSVIIGIRIRILPPTSKTSKKNLDFYISVTS
jgi:hypothetical protein